MQACESDSFRLSPFSHGKRETLLEYYQERPVRTDENGGNSFPFHLAFQFCSRNGIILCSVLQSKTRTHNDMGKTGIRYEARKEIKTKRGKTAKNRQQQMPLQALAFSLAKNDPRKTRKVTDDAFSGGKKWT